MINFIIIEDDEHFLKKLGKVVHTYMKEKKLPYKVYKSQGYGKTFNMLSQKDVGFKVYILDIRTKKGSGLDAAREIREVYGDWNSVILYVTAYDHYRFEALSNRLFILDFISKNEKYENELRLALDKTIKYYDHRQKCIVFDTDHVTNRVDFRNIVYIEKEPQSKNCIIKTTFNEVIIPGSLVEISKHLDERFKRIHRALIINMDQIDYFDPKTNILTFKEGSKTDLISREMKKGLKENVVRCRV